MARAVATGCPPRIKVNVPVRPLATVVVPQVAAAVPALAVVVLAGTNSPGSRANRDVLGAVAAGRRGTVSSVARCSIEAIFVTEMTSRFSAREQAVSTGPAP